MALAIYGPTGIGKTLTLFNYLLSKKKNVLFCRSLEDLSEFNDQTDIIFDDISFCLSRPELLIHLCDRNFHGSVRILRQCIRIPSTVRKWFTHNSSENWEPLLATQEQLYAIARRISVVRVNNRDEITAVIKQHICSFDEEQTERWLLDHVNDELSTSLLNLT